MALFPLLQPRVLGLLGPFLPGFPLFVSAQDIVINEVDADQSGSDRGEFIELYDGGVGNTPLDGLVVVLFNGSNDSSYLTFDLDGFSTDANGLFVIGNPGVANVAIELDPGSSGAIQNGPDAVALYVGNDADFPNGTPATSDDLIDALVYGTNDPDALNLLDVLVPGQDQLNDTPDESMARIPDGGAARDTSTYINQTPTPGLRNKADEALNLGISIAPDTISESSPTPAVATITRTGPTDAAATILIEASDRTEVFVVDSNAIFGIGEASIEVNLQPIDDLWADGTQTVTITVREESNALNPADATIDVEDDGDKNGMVVNEVYPAVDNFSGDANGDGEILNSLDEFVELVNATDTAINLSSFTIWDSMALQHTFPEGTVIEPGCAVVVFGGGNIDEGLLEEFGNATVQKTSTANEFGLNLNNNGDIVSIRNLNGIEVAGASWDAVNSGDGSLTRNPDVTGDFDFHALAGFDSFGPGYDIDGKPFCAIERTLSLDAVPSTIAENAGPGAAVLTVTRTGSTAEAVVVTLTNDDPSELTIPSEATIPAGQATVDVAIDAVDDPADDGTQTVSITASAAGYVLGRTDIQVADDGDPPVAVVINEFDPDQESTDDREFIELYDGGTGNLPLDGLIIVLFNGTSGQSYRTVDLAGQSTDANGFFVVGSPTLAQAGLAFSVATNAIQNAGDAVDAVAVYRDSSDNFPNGSSAIETNLVDAVVYGDAEAADDSELLRTLTPNGSRIDEDPDRETHAIARVPDGGAAFDTSAYRRQAPTPGTTNGEGSDKSGFVQWALSYPGVGGPNDNNDTDPMRNALEYALGLNPSVSDAHALPVPAIHASGELAFTVSKGEIAGSDPNLTYIVEVSTDLTNWTTDGLAIAADTASELVVTYPGGAEDIYMRLRVELAE